MLTQQDGPIWQAAYARLDRGLYPSGIKVTQKELDIVLIVPAKFRGKWNHKIRPA
jgi:hypothetical protein